MLNRSERVLVAGAGGFIGGHLVRHLAEQGFESIRAADIKPVSDWWQVHPGVESLQLDLGLPAAAQQAADGCAWILNLAADMGGLGFIAGNEARCMLSVAINAALLTAAQAAGARRYFYASSASVYPADLQASVDAPPLSETDAYPAMPPDGYGWEKLFSERLCAQFSADFGLPTRVARFENVYGDHGPWDGGRERAPAALCRKVAEAVLAGADEIEIWGDGKQGRAFVHVDDCIRGTLLITDSDLAEPVNVGSAELVSVNQLLDVIEDIADVRLKRRYNLTQPGGVRSRRTDGTLIRSALGWAPAVPLRDGLAATYQWVFEQVSARTLTGRRRHAP